ncbi:MAG: hypoxanthine phosphoribosyltransferase [Saprospiraceae bacterium]|nr:hypoxanthine phosphoribosyltransferase [Saprospiraceae bacterium]
MDATTEEMIVIKDKTFKPLIDAKQIRERTSEVADAISADLAGRDPLVIAVLNGAFIFAADLTRFLSFDPEIHFIKLASYHAMQSSGAVAELIGLDESKVRGRDILIIEDIVDSGNTLAFLRKQLGEMGAESIRIVAMLLKPNAFGNRFPVDYVCFEIPDAFVIGYGLDYDGYGRSLDGVYQLDA